jgi:hypothetical protein
MRYHRTAGSARIISRSDGPRLGARNGSNRVAGIRHSKMPGNGDGYISKAGSMECNISGIGKRKLSKSVVISLELLREHSSPALLGSIKTVEPTLYS